jgi:hypothetical protein
MNFCPISLVVPYAPVRFVYIYVYNLYTVYTVCHFHSVSRVFRMSVDFLPMVHPDCKLRRANRLRIQAAKKPQLKRM